MGKFEDLLDVLFGEDEEDKDDVTVEVHIVDKDTDEEEPHEKDEELHRSQREEVEELHQKAKAQHDEIVEKFGKETADAVVDFAAYCAMINALIRKNIPLDQEIVDGYNALCEKLHPEGCDPFIKFITYAAIREMVKEGKKSLG